MKAGLEAVGDNLAEIDLFIATIGMGRSLTVVTTNQ